MISLQHSIMHMLVIMAIVGKTFFQTSQAYFLNNKMEKVVLSTFEYIPMLLILVNTIQFQPKASVHLISFQTSNHQLQGT